MKSVLWIALLALLAIAIRGHNIRSTFIDARIYFVDADCYSRMTRAAVVDESPGTIVRHQDFENYPEGVDPHTTAPLDYLIIGLKRIIQPLPVLQASVLRTQALDVAGALISPLLGLATCVFLGIWARKCLPAGTELSPVGLKRVIGNVLWFLALVGGALVGKWIGAGAVILVRFMTERREWVASPAAFVFALSPILVHGTLLGRPDHQSLLIFLVAVALGAEWASSNHGGRTWPVVAGLAWGFALWVSVYEPLILLIAVTGFRAIESMIVRKFPAHYFPAENGMAADPSPAESTAAPAPVVDAGSTSPKAWLKWAIIAAIVVIALVIERWHFRLLDESLKQYFGNWSASIGELRHLNPRKPTLYRWLSYLCIASPVLLFLAARRDRRAISVLGMLLLAFGLTCWQLRWGYFLALIFAMSLPWQFIVLRKRWIAWPVLIIALLPTWQEWDEQLFPSTAAQKQMNLRRMELTQLREVADTMKDQPKAGFIAPWWLSPPLAYWSGHPGVAGSSHESLAGIVATAKFYTSSDLQAAREILEQRRVGWVLADDPSRVISTSRTVLGSGPPENPLINTLAESPKDAPPFLVGVALKNTSEEQQAAGQPQFFRLYRVQLQSTQP